MTTLRCVSRYENGARGLVYEAGQVVDVTPQLAVFLMADAPGCFVHLDDEGDERPAGAIGRAIAKPKRHRAVQEPQADK